MSASEPEQSYSGLERRRAGAGCGAAGAGRPSRRLLTALSEAAAQMVTADTVERVTVVAVQAAVAAVGADGGTVAVADREGKVLTLVSTEQYNPDLVRAHPRLAVSAALPISHTARTGELLLLRTRAEAAERFPQVVAHQQLTDRAGLPIVSAAVLPLRADKRLLGSLTVTWASERRFSPGDVELLEGAG